LFFFANAGVAAEFKSETFLWGGNARWLSITNNSTFKVNVSDQVTDGCWTNSTSVKTAVELELKRSGFKLATDKDSFSYRINLNTLGFEKAGICVTSYKMEMLWLGLDYVVFDGHRVTSLGNRIFWRRSGIYTGGKNIISGGLKETYVNIIQEFLVDIDKKKKENLDNILEVSKKDAKAKAYWEKFIFE
jgi:hypothetical protein